MTAIKPESIEAEEAALAAVGAPLPSSFGSPDRCSDVALARRLRAKRLGVAPETDPKFDKIIFTLREINWLVLSPWAKKDHPWTKGDAKPGETLVAPSITREMGARVIDLFDGHLRARAKTMPDDANDVVLDEIDYRRAPSIGRAEQMLNEVRWFIDGQLAIAWNPIAHFKAMEAYERTSDGFALQRAMRLCWRRNSKREFEFAISLSSVRDSEPHNRVLFAGGVRHAKIDCVWGECDKPNYEFKDGLAFVAALNVVHRFEAHI